MNTDIELMKLYNGEYIVGKFNSDDGDKITLKDPRIVFIVPTRTTNEIAMIVKPITVPFFSNRLKESADFYKSQIEFRLFDNLGEIEKAVIDGYNSEVSGIEIASASTLNAIDAVDSTAQKNGGLII